MCIVDSLAGLRFPGCKSLRLSAVTGDVGCIALSITQRIVSYVALSITQCIALSIVSYAALSITPYV